jgi:hypothetical protein
MQQTQQLDPLKQQLICQLESMLNKSPIKYKQLIGSLLEWGAVTKCAGQPTFYYAMKSQIEYQAKKKGCSEEQFVNYLFSQKGAEEWMLAFQL